MSWHAIAYKNVHDARRSRTLWLLTGLLALLFVGYTGLYTYFDGDNLSELMGGLVRIVGMGVPALAVLLGYRSISDERSSGSLLLTLSFPTSREALLVGTFVGRTVVLLVPTLLTLALAGLVGVVGLGVSGLGMYLWFLVATAVYGTTFVAIAVALSASATNDRRITFGAVGSYLLLVNFWDGLASFGVEFLHRFERPFSMPDWGLLFQLLSPNQSFLRLLRAGTDTERASRYAVEGAPLYVDWWVPLLILAGWCVVPMALVYWRFETADL